MIQILIWLGFLCITAFSAWRGQTLLSRHIELKHEREMARLGMDRMEKSVRLEMDQTRNLAEIERMNGESDRLARQRDEIIETERLRLGAGTP